MSEDDYSRHLMITRRFFNKLSVDHGTHFKALDYNQRDRHETRLNRILDFITNRYESLYDARISDLGCGYGRFCEMLFEQGYRGFHYHGLDISELQVQNAEKYLKEIRNTGDVSILCAHGSISEICDSDIIVMSGVFNKKFDISYVSFFEQVKRELELAFSRTKDVVLVNFLTDNIDFDYKRSDLFYASPSQLVTFASTLTPHFSLLHDYGIFDQCLVLMKYPIKL